MILTFTCQSALLSVAMFLYAIKSDESELYISAILTIVLKVIFIPYLLKYFVRKLNIRHKVATVQHRFLLLLGATALVLFCYRLIIPIGAVSWTHDNNTIAVAMAVMLLGVLLLITHKKAIAHVIGFMAMESGIFLAAMVATKGVPILVEVGIVFDALVATILFGIFFSQLRRSIDSLDVDRLNLLREDVE
jgi:hydrogenase-4 component E